MSDGDVQRAIAIINRACEGSFYDPQRIPEADGDKLVVAEQIVQNCEQVEKIVHRAFPGESDQGVIAKKVPHWPIVSRILEEAKVLVGANEPDEPEPVASPSDQDVGPGAARDAAPEPAAAATTVDRREPATGEVWADHNGAEWEVVSYSGGMSAEVKSVVSGERTIVPAGFLKSRRLRVVSVVQPEPTEAPGDESTTTLKDDSPAEQEAVVGPLRPASDEPVRPPANSLEPDVLDRVEAGDIEAHYEEVVGVVQDRYDRAGMPAPGDLEHPPEIAPEAFADADDATARSLHSKYNALAARAKFLHDVEDAIARECKIAREGPRRIAMRRAREELGPKATVTEVAMAADEDEAVVAWSRWIKCHADEASAFKTFHDIYAEHVTVLSRDWSMREAQVR